ncbi:MAG: MarR family transcriptional regulator [Verrucomicrobiae bacterium]|nr:MarR family transcriptional regulator [Verrucomicrobiae bacterium]
MELSNTQKRYVLHWGEMGMKWGINRTVAQIHALLFVSEDPLNAEQITETLGVARSNVSNSLKELQGWGIVRVVHVLGDRRDHFETIKDVWELFRIIGNERKRREYDPTIVFLQNCIEDADKDGSDAYTKNRLKELYAFMNTTSKLYAIFHHWPAQAIMRFVKLGDKVRQLLNLS